MATYKNKNTDFKFYSSNIEISVPTSKNGILIPDKPLELINILRTTNCVSGVKGDKIM